MACFVDILIDYPNSKIYIEHLFERLCQENILTESLVTNYRLHIEKVEKQGIDIDDYADWSPDKIWVNCVWMLEENLSTQWVYSYFQ